jgi:hypothetical protein
MKCTCFTSRSLGSLSYSLPHGKIDVTNGTSREPGNLENKVIEDRVITNKDNKSDIYGILTRVIRASDPLSSIAEDFLAGSIALSLSMPLLR